jgi:hypothetical protein
MVLASVFITILNLKMTKIKYRFLKRKEIIREEDLHLFIPYGGKNRWLKVEYYLVGEKVIDSGMFKRRIK